MSKVCAEQVAHCLQAGPLDANAAAAMLHDMPSAAQRGSSNSAAAPATSAALPASSAPPATSGAGDSEPNGSKGDLANNKGDTNGPTDMKVPMCCTLREA